MKPTLLFATLTMVFASPSLSAKSELEILRAKCAEQERQIEQLEQDNSKLRVSTTSTHSLGSQTELISTAASKPIESAKPAEASKPATAPGSVTYVVKAGDSMEKIARKVSVSPNTLAKANGLKANAMIHPGQKLKVPGTALAAASAPKETAAPSKTSEAAASNSSRSYKVRDNDTYASIARKQKVSVDSLIAANPSVKPTALRTGQIISLGGRKTPAEPAAVAKTAPSPAPATTTPVLAAKTPAPAQKAPPAPFAKAPASSAPAHSPAAPAKTESAPVSSTAETSSPTPESKIRPITIDGEMTYGEFATKHGTSSERLNALNGLDLNNATVLAKGSELYVPAQP